MRRNAGHTTRRGFFRRTALGAVAATLGGAHAQESAQAIPLAAVDRVWLGPELWANRLQDWRLNSGWVECVNAGPTDLARTVSLLTRSIEAGAQGGAVEVTIRRVSPSGAPGFGGFLIGAGGGRLDWRAAALCHAASGEGGGFFAVVDHDGRLAFKDHESEALPYAFTALPGEYNAGGRVDPGRPLVLRVAFTPRAGLFDVTVSAIDPVTRSTLATLVRRDVPDAAICGGVHLVSSCASGASAAGARWAMRSIATEGAKIAVHPDRTFGPVWGALHSLNAGVLKLTVQFPPLGARDSRITSLECRQAGGSWMSAGESQIDEFGVASFRVQRWDSESTADYRVVYDGVVAFEGVVRADPGAARALKIALLNCVLVCGRTLDGTHQPPRQLPMARHIGRFRPENFFFPHAEMNAHLGVQDPDILLFAGDQFYEHNPTRIEKGQDIILDMTYRWALWYWSFRDLARSRPSIFLTDDHDVYHGNIWGQGGRAAPLQDQNRGGYVYPARFVAAVERMQKSHNPDPHDPTPIEQGLPVSYGAFDYGGVRFAFIEDRKWKTAPIQGEDLNVHAGELLGRRQEDFLRTWGKAPGRGPRILVTATLWGSLQTSPDGEALVDFDANSYPPLARLRAVRLVRDANALMLSGDQHLSSVVRHGIDAPDDGPVQFTAPAIATFWQRWFEPKSEADAVDFVDAFGARMRVMAVANPKLTFAQYRETVQGRYQGVDDRSLRSEGYGIVRVDHARRQFVLECWPWDENPAAPAARQFKGWPIRVPFDQAGRR